MWYERAAVVRPDSAGATVRTDGWVNAQQIGEELGERLHESLVEPVSHRVFLKKT
jgi:hypothetical protein